MSAGGLLAGIAIAWMAPSAGADDRARVAAKQGSPSHATLYFNPFCESCVEEVPLARRWLRRHPGLTQLAVAFRTPASLGREYGRKLGLRMRIVGDQDGRRSARAGVREPTVIVLKRDDREVRRVEFHVGTASARHAARHKRRKRCGAGKRAVRRRGLTRCVMVKPRCPRGTVLKRPRNRYRCIPIPVRQPIPKPEPRPPILPNVRVVSSFAVPEIQQGLVHVQGFSWCYLCQEDQSYFELQAWQDAHPDVRQVAFTCAADRRSASDFARPRGWRFPVLVLKDVSDCLEFHALNLGGPYWGANVFLVDGVPAGGDCRFSGHPKARYVEPCGAEEPPSDEPPFPWEPPPSELPPGEQPPGEEPPSEQPPGQQPPGGSPSPPA